MARDYVKLYERQSVLAGLSTPRLAAHMRPLNEMTIGEQQPTLRLGTTTAQ